MQCAKLLKFVTGDIVIATVDVGAEIEHCPDYIEIGYPIEVLTQLIPDTDGFKERYNLKPWQALSNRNKIVIDSSTLMFIEPLKDNYAKGYWDMVDYFYLADNKEEVSTSIEEHIDEIEKEMLEEYEDKIIH